MPKAPPTKRVWPKKTPQNKISQIAEWKALPFGGAFSLSRQRFQDHSEMGVAPAGAAAHI